MRRTLHVYCTALQSLRVNFQTLIHANGLLLLDVSGESFTTRARSAICSAGKPWDSKEDPGAHTDCMQLAGSYVQTGVTDSSVQRVLPEEEEAVLAAGTMGRTAEIGADGTLWPLWNMWSPGCSKGSALPLVLTVQEQAGRTEVGRGESLMTCIYVIFYNGQVELMCSSSD